MKTILIFLLTTLSIFTQSQSPTFQNVQVTNSIQIKGSSYFTLGSSGCSGCVLTNINSRTGQAAWIVPKIATISNPPIDSTNNAGWFYIIVGTDSLKVPYYR